MSDVQGYRHFLVERLGSLSSPAPAVRLELKVSSIRMLDENTCICPSVDHRHEGPVSGINGTIAPGRHMEFRALQGVVHPAEFGASQQELEIADDLAARPAAALAKLRPIMGFDAPAWTANAPLPGGDLPDDDFDTFLTDLQVVRSWLPPDLAQRYARAFGTRVERLLGAARSLRDLGGRYP